MATKKKKTPARKTYATSPAPKKAASKVKGKRSTKPAAGKSDVPQLFRLNLEVSNLDAAAGFYTELLGIQGRKLPGARVYFDCGPVTLQVVYVSSVRAPHPAAKALYFTVRDLEAAFVRAKGLRCLSQENVHDAPGGGIVVRPWGERSFYAEDSWGNPLCFVEQGTVYTG